VALLEGEVAGPVNIGSGSAIAVRDLVLRLVHQPASPKLVQFGAPIEEPPVLTASIGRAFKRGRLAAEI